MKVRVRNEKVDELIEWGESEVDHLDLHGVILHSLHHSWHINLSSKPNHTYIFNRDGFYFPYYEFWFLAFWSKKQNSKEKLYVWKSVYDGFWNSAKSVSRRIFYTTCTHLLFLPAVVISHHADSGVTESSLTGKDHLHGSDGAQIGVQSYYIIDTGGGGILVVSSDKTVIKDGSYHHIKAHLGNSGHSNNVTAPLTEHVALGLGWETRSLNGHSLEH